MMKPHGPTSGTWLMIRTSILEETPPPSASAWKENSSDIVSLPVLPLIVAGTSFGSLIGLYTVLSGEHKFHAAAWGSPMVGVSCFGMESKLLVKPLAAIIPSQAANRDDA
ncbi:hypothetical protein DVH05_002520 [Phytophthora capsici]|nr:hypothetical protein DVH05_002520 [Phytophthora capsici]